MADTEPSRHRRARRRRCAGRACAVDRSALEPERGRLALFPEQGRRVRRARRRATGRDRGAAALLGGQRLDQHGAGDRELAPPRHRDQAGRCLPRRGDQARPHDLARRDARRRHRLRPARLHADAAIAAAAAGEAGKASAVARRYRPAASTPSPHAIASAMGFDRSTLLSEFAARAGSRIVSDGDAMALVRDGRTARHIGPLFADTRRSARWRWSMPSSDPRPGRC